MSLREAEAQLADLEKQLKETRQLVGSQKPSQDLQDIIKTLSDAAEELREAIKEMRFQQIDTESVSTKVNVDQPEVFCEVSVSSGVSLLAKIVSRKSDSVRVLFLDQQISKEYPDECVRILPEIVNCKEGQKVQGYKDGKWHKCVVVRKQGNSAYEVRFDKVVQVVPAQLIRVKSEESGDVYVTPAGYKIPVELKITEKDSEKSKDSKKRKIEHLKKEQRFDKFEQEADQRKNHWQSFQKSLKK